MSRILIAEDEPRIADFLLRGLREEGYVVEHARDGRAAGRSIRTRLMPGAPSTALATFDCLRNGEVS